MRDALEQHYGYLFEDNLLQEIEACSIYKKIPKGQAIMNIGEPIVYLPLLLEGAIKILREDENGDELILYFLEKGDTCAMTITCGMQNATSEVRAVTENETELLLVPAEKMQLWVTKYASWQQFIFDSYHTRMMDFLETVDTLAFLKMDERLLKYLQDKAKVTHDASIINTHQEIAYDLHTSRVVISRLLKKLEHQGVIKMQRNHIIVLDL